MSENFYYTEAFVKSIGHENVENGKWYFTIEATESFSFADSLSSNSESRILFVLDQTFDTKNSTAHLFSTKIRFEIVNDTTLMTILYEAMKNHRKIRIYRKEEFDSNTSLSFDRIEFL